MRKQICTRCWSFWHGYGHLQRLHHSWVGLIFSFEPARQSFMRSSYGIGTGYNLYGYLLFS